jgi:uncharacterized protein YkwD
MRRGPSVAVLVFVFLVVACSAFWADGGGRPAQRSTFQSLATLENQTHARVNDYRASRGLPLLAWSDVVADQARRHSLDMATGAVGFGHDGFKQRAAAIDRTIPWIGVSENLYMMTDRPDPAAAAVAGWVDSADHRKHIEGDFDMTGVGIARAPDGRLYFTQIFVKSQPVSRSGQ